MTIVSFKKVHLSVIFFFYLQGWQILQLQLWTNQQCFLNGPFRMLQIIWTRIDFWIFLLYIIIVISVFDFRLALLSLAIIYIFTSFGVQCLIDYCSIPACSCRCSSNSAANEGTPLNSVNVNVLYRPYTLTTQQLANEFPQPTALNLPSVF